MVDNEIQYRDSNEPDTDRLIPASSLQTWVQAIFQSAGSDENEAKRLAHYLVEANLAGHDSHGVIRVAYYVDYVRNGQVRVNQHAKVVLRTDSIVVVDGGSGFGQIIAEEALQLAIEQSELNGVCVLAIRNCGHVGRVGDWPMQAARAGKVSLHFVNTTGFGLLVAPFGGIDRRLSANPIAAGIPRQNAEPIILDISTAAIAEGKIKVARNKGITIPEGCITDAEGNPTVDPADFYADPPGAIKAFGAHKGYGLGIVAELLAGALSGSGCSKPGADRLLNGMLSIVLDPSRIPRNFDFAEEVEAFVSFVKSSRLATPQGEILMPGEMETRIRDQRIANGILLDAQTLAALQHTAKSLNVSRLYFEDPS